MPQKRQFTKDRKPIKKFKRLSPNVLIAYAQKNTGMRIKNTHMRIKFLLSLVCFILLFTEHAYIRVRISACVLFYAWQRIKYGHGMHIFQAFKKNFLRYDVIRLLSVVVVVLAFKTLNLDSILTIINFFIFT